MEDSGTVTAQGEAPQNGNGVVITPATMARFMGDGIEQASIEELRVMRAVCQQLQLATYEEKIQAAPLIGQFQRRLNVSIEQREAEQASERHSVGATAA